MSLKALETRVTALQSLFQSNSSRISTLMSQERTMATDLSTIRSSMERIEQKLSLINHSIAPSVQATKSLDEISVTVSPEAHTNNTAGNVDSGKLAADLSSKMVPVIIAKECEPLEELALAVMGNNQVILVSAKEDLLHRVEVPTPWDLELVTKNSGLNFSNTNWYDGLHMFTGGEDLLVQHKWISAMCDMKHTGLEQWCFKGGTMQIYPGLSMFLSRSFPRVGIYFGQYVGLTWFCGGVQQSNSMQVCIIWLLRAVPIIWHITSMSLWFYDAGIPMFTLTENALILGTRNAIVVYVAYVYVGVIIHLSVLNSQTELATQQDFFSWEPGSLLEIKGVSLWYSDHIKVYVESTLFVFVLNWLCMGTYIFYGVDNVPTASGQPSLQLDFGIDITFAVCYPSPTISKFINASKGNVEGKDSLYFKWSCSGVNLYSL